MGEELDKWSLLVKCGLIVFCIIILLLFIFFLIWHFLSCGLAIANLAVLVVFHGQLHSIQGTLHKKVTLVSFAAGYKCTL